MIARVREKRRGFDVVIIGGGATGVGIAVDAASRGYDTLLLEQADFGKGTSSRATKLVHGGVRYLRQGNIKLVREALRERQRLLANAPHVVRRLKFLMPSYRWWEKPFFGIGLKLYDLLAGQDQFAPSRMVSRSEAMRLTPTLEPRHLYGGVFFEDGQFDDARLLINLMQTAAEQGAVVLNYCPVSSLKVDREGITRGLVARDSETGEEFHVGARVIVNATGVFVDTVRQMADRKESHLVRASQGIHLVVDRSFLPGDTAIIVPSTDDGRVLFVIPWNDHVIIGTTDVPVDKIDLEPRARPEEIQFVLDHSARYLTRDPTPDDVLSIYAGLRPLVNAGAKRTAALPRDHLIRVERSGLVTITGGKWTTYRKMAEDVVDLLPGLTGLPRVACRTIDLPIHGHHTSCEMDPSHRGSDRSAVKELASAKAEWGERIHPNLPYEMADIVWSARHEMARTVEDVLARRTRSLFMNAKASIEAAPRVASVMGRELCRDDSWVQEQTRLFRELAEGYMMRD